MDKVADQHPEIVGMSLYELFCKYYDDQLRQLLVDESNQYGQQKNSSSFNDVDDLDVGILLLSG